MLDRDVKAYAADSCDDERPAKDAQKKGRTKLWQGGKVTFTRPKTIVTTIEKGGYVKMSHFANKGSLCQVGKVT